MSGQTQFRIPVLPYLKKYIVKQFFSGAKGPYKIEEDTLLGKQVMSLLIDARKIDFIDKHLEMSETLEVELSHDLAKRSPRMNKLVCLNFFADKIFKTSLITWIKSAEHFGIRPFPASKGFLEYFGIEESEYSHDAAYRLWHRSNIADFNQKVLGRRRTKKGAAVS